MNCFITKNSIVIDELNDLEDEEAKCFKISRYFGRTNLIKHKKRN